MRSDQTARIVRACTRTFALEADEPFTTTDIVNYFDLQAGTYHYQYGPINRDVPIADQLVRNTLNELLTERLIKQCGKRGREKVYRCSR